MQAHVGTSLASPLLAYKRCLRREFYCVNGSQVKLALALNGRKVPLEAVGNSRVGAGVVAEICG